MKSEVRGRREGRKRGLHRKQVVFTNLNHILLSVQQHYFNLIGVSKAKAPTEGLNGFSLHLEKNVSVCQLLSEIGVTFEATQLLVIHSYEVSATSLTLFKSRIIV